MVVFCSSGGSSPMTVTPATGAISVTLWMASSTSPRATFSAM